MNDYDWIISEKMRPKRNKYEITSKSHLRCRRPVTLARAPCPGGFIRFDGIWWIRLNTQPITGSSSPCFDIWHLKAQRLQLCKWFTQPHCKNDNGKASILLRERLVFSARDICLMTKSNGILKLLPSPSCLFFGQLGDITVTSLCNKSQFLIPRYPLVCLCVCLTRCFHSENPVLEQNNISGSQRRSTLSSKGQRFSKWILHMENPNFISLTSLTMDRSKHWTCIISKHRHCFWTVWNKGTYQTVLLQCFCSKIHYSCLQSFDPTPLSHLENLFGVD